MINIRPYTATDCKNVLAFLKAFNPNISHNEWQKLLDYTWANKTNLVGMLLENQNQVVGFISYIIHTTDGVGEDYLTNCNLSSWVVNPQFRSKSMQLLSPVFKLKNCTILNLTPHPNTWPMFNALRFQTLSDYEYIANPLKVKLYARGMQKNKIEIEKITTQNLDKQDIDANIKKIVADHAPYTNVVFYKFSIPANGIKENLVLAFNQKAHQTNSSILNTLKELPYKILNHKNQFELLYASSHTVLAQNLASILSAFIKNQSVRSLTISDCFVGKDINAKYLNIAKKSRPWFIYADTEIDYASIHLLYTEKVLLNF